MLPALDEVPPPGVAAELEFAAGILVDALPWPALGAPAAGAVVVCALAMAAPNTRAEMAMAAVEGLRTAMAFLRQD